MKDNKIVWFNSLGKNDDGSAIKADNFSENVAAVTSSITQRLSVLKNELWYNVEYGLPLFDKVRRKVEIDIVVAGIIESHPDVVNIENFTSQIINRRYSCNVTINTKEGTLNIQI